MTKFKVLPTNEDFRNLTNDQIDLILHSMEEDYRQADRARRGLGAEDEGYDESFEDEVWNRDVGDWEVLKEGHDPNEIAKQVEQLTREEDQKNLYSKFENLEEYNAFREAGGKTDRENEVEQYINRQIQAAEEKAKMMREDGKGKRLVDDKDNPDISDNSDNSTSELDKQAIERSIEMFNAQDDDDDEFTKL